jgi:ABC-type oligopeptide transport system substrate-binding subunit
MSDVYKSEHNSCYNSTSDNVSPEQIFIIISVSASFIVMLSLLLLTLCSAIQVAKKLSSTSLNVDTYVEPDVIVVEESKDLTSQNSNQQLTLNSRDLLEEFYEKLPSSENSDNNHIQM